MSVPTILTLLGVPSIVSACVLFTVRSIRAERKKNAEAREQERKNLKTLELGVQALLRAQMTHDYYKYTGKGYAPMYAKENFENMWLQYHALGANGVMDGVHAEFMALPTTNQEVSE